MALSPDSLLRHWLATRRFSTGAVDGTVHSFSDPELLAELSWEVRETISFGVRSHGERQNLSNNFQKVPLSLVDMVSRQRLRLARRSRTSHTGCSHPAHETGSPRSRTNSPRLPRPEGENSYATGACQKQAAEGRDMCRAVGRDDRRHLTEVLSIIFNTGQRESRHVEGGWSKCFLRELRWV